MRFFSKEIFATQTAFANFVSFFSKKNERKSLDKLRTSDKTLIHNCMHYAVQLRNERGIIQVLGGGLHGHGY